MHTNINFGMQGEMGATFENNTKLRTSSKHLGSSELLVIMTTAF